MAKYDPTTDEAYSIDRVEELQNCNVDVSLSENGWNLKFSHISPDGGFSTEFILSSMMVDDWETLLAIAEEGLERAKRSAKNS